MMWFLVELFELHKINVTYLPFYVRVISEKLFEFFSLTMQKVKVLVAQLCPILCDPMDCGPPGSSVHGILQARTLEWVAILFSRESSQPRDQTGFPSLQADSLLSELPGNHADIPSNIY